MIFKEILKSKPPQMRAEKVVQQNNSRTTRVQHDRQGFETRDARMVVDVLPLPELPNLFCALSFYPSEREKKDITNEIKYGEYADTGLLVSTVDVGTALKSTNIPS